MNKIALFGAVGKSITTSGQIIRTRILYSALCNRYGENNVVLIDTCNIKYNVFGIIIGVLKYLFYCNSAVFILSRNGIRFLWPFIYYSSNILNKKSYNNVVGGNLNEFLIKNHRYIKYMNGFSINWVQLAKQKEILSKMGINNIEVLPNSKPLNILAESQVVVKNNDLPYKLCTFSRISEAKGIELAIQVVDKINSDVGKLLVTLDIYGKPDSDYEDRFTQIMSNASKAIKYYGIVPFDQSTNVLKKYFLLLFPTTFYGEGFPGTILDAYAAGLPVIASSWKFNAELVVEGKTGFIYDYKKPEKLYQTIMKAVLIASEVNNMRINCIKEAYKYTPEKVMPIIFNRIDESFGKKE